MAATFVIACPECDKKVQASEEHIGKKIRCKGCGHVYSIKDPSEPPPPPKASKGKAPPPTPKKAAPPPPPPEPELDEFNDKNPYGLTKEVDTIARCPFCAQQMESNEAVICLGCGYNTRTRLRPEVKAVFQPTFFDWVKWQGPAAISVLTMIGFIVWFVIFWYQIEGWLKGSALEETSQDGQVTYIGALSPSFFRMIMAIALIAASVPLVRFSWRRILKNTRPPEKKIKDED